MKAEVPRTHAQDHGAPTGTFDQIADMLNELSLSARTIARQLHPGVLDQFGLAKALRRLVEKVEGQHDLDIAHHSELETDKRYSSLVERTAYRVVQEALVNVVRHARTDTAEVIIHQDRNELRLHVLDEGVGFEIAKKDEAENYGLNGIIDRVERLGGTVDIRTASAEGTRISTTLPLNTSSIPAAFADEHSL